MFETIKQHLIKRFSWSKTNKTPLQQSLEHNKRRIQLIKILASMEVLIHEKKPGNTVMNNAIQSRNLEDGLDELCEIDVTTVPSGEKTIEIKIDTDGKDGREEYLFKLHHDQLTVEQAIVDGETGLPHFHPVEEELVDRIFLLWQGFIDHGHATKRHIDMKF